MGNKKLLEFYQNKFDEFFKGDDKYKEKVDKHLKELIADRYELEAEVTRKGVKISSLQKALVDLQLSCFEERERFLNVSNENERLKKNEELLHKNIRQLLMHTKDRDLRDRIIYILQDPNVEIHCRHVEGKSAGTSASSSNKKKSTSDLFKEEIQQLQSKIDEYSRISKSSSDVLLEDCKVCLEKSREKISEDEQEMRKLQKKIQEKEAEIRHLNQNQSDLRYGEKDRASPLHSDYERYSTQQNRRAGTSKSVTELPRTRITIPSTSRSDDVIYKASSQSPRTISSEMLDLKFSLNSVTQISLKMESLLKNIKSAETFVLAAKQPTSRAVTKCVADDDIEELQDCMRQCTRLSCDIQNIWTTLSKKMIEQNVPVRQRDVEQLGTAVNDLSVSTAETEILSLGLARAQFFDYLTSGRVLLSDFDDSDHLKCVADVVTIEDKVKSATVSVKTATDIIERIDRNIDLGERYQTKTLPGRRSEEEQTDTIHLISSESNSNTAPRSNRFQADTLPKQMNDFNPIDVRRTRSEPIGGGEVIRKIDKTLSKIRQIERGEYAKDNELCKHLAEQIRGLSERLKALYEEFNVRDVQDSFTAYSQVTLSKLETLARQSRDTVIAAEGQISAYRSNAEVLSEKLRDTQELLRESINECLGLKRKLKQVEISRGADEVEDDARQTFLRTKNVRDTVKPRSPDNTRRTFFRTLDLDGNETSVKRLASSSRMPEGPFDCMFCKQGSDHKLCGEKIRELQAVIRKLTVQLKNLEKEAKHEKRIAQVHKEGAEKTNLELENEKKCTKETITGLESKNASLLDQLKVLKNRLKHIETFRRLEIEGFQTDIRNLKTKIKELERQLARAVLIYEQDQKDMELLKSIHDTAKRSKSSVAALKRLKAKLYELETDIRRI